MANMEQHIGSLTLTVVPDDHLIIVNGEALRFDYPAPSNLHALHWDGTSQSGHMEWTDDYNMALNASLYEEEVAPYLKLWEAEKARLEKEARKAEAAALAEYDSQEARFERLRDERDKRISATDYLLMSDYPLSSEQKAQVAAYRQALRDLPAKEGAPWDGGGELTPWPDKPAIEKNRFIR